MSNPPGTWDVVKPQTRKPKRNAYNDEGERASGRGSSSRKRSGLFPPEK